MKKQLITILILSLLTSASVPAFSQNTNSAFKDTANHWSKSYVDRLFKEGYVKGSGGNFYPEQALKTEDFLIMVVKVLDPNAKTLSADEGAPYYTPFMNHAAKLGLIKSDYDEVPQYVERMMPRELAVQVIDRALALKGETVVADHGLEYKFKDYKIINDINKEAVLKTYQLGIIKGSNGNFEPKNPLTRAEAAVLVSKLLDKGLRDKLTFSINPKVFDEVSAWYMNGYDAITGRRTVVIEKKVDGSINNGDRDYFETRKWWSDQEFENLVMGGISNGSLIDVTNSIRHPVGCTMEEIVQNKLDLKLAGGYFVRDGEINLMNYDYDNPNGFKFYDAEIDNLNRMIYDLTKYTVQFAKENGKIANIEYLGDDKILVSYQDDKFTDSLRFGVLVLLNSKEAKKNFKLQSNANISFEYDGFSWKQDEAYIKQVIYRLYGKDKGAKAFEFLKANLKDRTVKSTGDFSKVSNGVWYQLRDVDSNGPYIYTFIE